MTRYPDVLHSVSVDKLTYIRSYIDLLWAIWSMIHCSVGAVVQHIDQLIHYLKCCWLEPWFWRLVDVFLSKILNPWANLHGSLYHQCINVTEVLWSTLRSQQTWKVTIMFMLLFVQIKLDFTLRSCGISFDPSLLVHYFLTAWPAMLEVSRWLIL